MAFNAITSTEIETGEPNKNSTWTKAKDNFDNHESRISDLEGGSAVAYPPLKMSVYGYYGYQGPATDWVRETINFDIRILGVHLLIHTAGSSGTTEVDIQVKSGAGAFASIFTTKPSLAYTDGSDSISTNTILDPAKVDLLAGDIIRLDTTSVQTDGVGLTVRIDYEKA